MAATMKQNGWFRFQMWLLILMAILSNGRLVEGKCRIRNQRGKEILLSALPKGIYYDEGTNILQCNRPISCRGWTITGCTAVQCQGYRACSGSQLLQNRGVACWATAACKDARIGESTHTVACVMEPDESHACRNTTISVDQSLFCYGPFACAGDSESSKIIFNVGAKGLVSCGGVTVDGHKAVLGNFACRNIIVRVNDISRACISMNIHEPQHCAVICSDDGDCDNSSIQFEVF